jgi:Protein of unknown function (DUF3499)
MLGNPTRVIYPARTMRTCAKMRCGSEPVATVSLRYEERQVLIGELVPERDPNLLDLCREHVDRMTPPVGWTVNDARAVAAALAT